MSITKEPEVFNERYGGGVALQVSNDTVCHVGRSDERK
jgi:hypothetical protein